ncbi:polysaccharide pyruvyl transferase family protein [Acidipropionibacterium jensenii]|uniref:polysaccharide pyruvyl transferase family protein n=1 Tax=Acidipropionibacterium jensenii TaxID=1749 RepID=UPI00110A1D4D|nr:polysaccharide pyruvyl transferase family protein [Acidipropionibacterium jensenii]QCV87443.1 polysaccharide pyruvyl transferase family protein [Acidipropionibacterium jensenii]
MILTTWLGRGNFGGVLQAYALQVALRSIGIEAVTDSTHPVVNRVRPIGLIKSEISGLSRGIAMTRAEARRRSHLELDRFIKEHMVTDTLFGVSGKPRRSVLQSFDTLVVGGDQVWRPNPWIESFFLDFVAGSEEYNRFAYGISFGTDKFTPDEISKFSRLRPLAREFRNISVREDMGVGLCAELLGVHAQWVADPVLLLSPDHYRDLCSAWLMTNTGSGLLSYILDDSALKSAIVSDVAGAVGMNATSVSPPDVPSGRAYQHDPSHWIKPSMEAWLGAFANCEFVITDSYHGVVLALLFHKPFIAIGNRKRGLSRFESLLDHVGLRSRLITDRSELSFPLPEIFWTDVQDSLDVLINRGWEFLRNSVMEDH